MIRLGDYNDLTVLRSTSVGIFLGDGEETEILLPNKYVPQEVAKNQVLRVFCYLDSAERPIATTLQPKILRDTTAALKVAAVGEFGSFMDWGLEKHLLVPFREQQEPMKTGETYLVHCYLDKKSFRLVGSSRLDRFAELPKDRYAIGDEVEAVAYRKSPLGWEVLLEGKFKGLIFHTDVFREIASGDAFKVFVKTVREDGKVDVGFQPIGAKMLEPTAAMIFDRLQQENGFLPLHDKSSPEAIKNELQISKKAFKKAIGVLYKQRKIEIKEDGIVLVVTK